MSDWPSCGCGCGEPVGAARQSDSRQGWVKGQPLRFLPHHKPRKPFEERYIVDAIGCWIWQGTKVKGGYGYIKLPDGSMTGAHRYSWERVNGPLPEGKEPHHVCENPSCVNPDHLEPVTHAENIRRSRMSKLSWEQVDEIRASSESQLALAERYGVAGPTINLIVNGKMWREETRG